VKGVVHKLWSTRRHVSRTLVPNTHYDYIRDHIHIQNGHRVELMRNICRRSRNGCLERMFGRRAFMYFMVCGRPRSRFASRDTGRILASDSTTESVVPTIISITEPTPINK